jgi:hypothetical protein
MTSFKIYDAFYFVPIFYAIVFVNILFGEHSCRILFITIKLINPLIFEEFEEKI